MAKKDELNFETDNKMASSEKTKKPYRLPWKR